MRRVVRLSAIATGFAVATSPVFASISFFDVFQTADYWQTSDAAPATYSDFRFASRIFSDNVTDSTGGTLSTPGGASLPMTQSGTVTAYYSPNYANQALMDADFGSGTYTLTIDSGTLAGQSGTIQTHNPDYPDTIPALTGTSFSSLQNLDPSQAANLTWNSFGHPGGANTELVFFAVYDLTAGGALVYGNSGAEGSYSGDTLAANSLLPNHKFQFGLFFSSRYEGSSADFGGSTSVEGYDFVTNGSFSTVPEPASFMALAPALALFARRRPAKG